MHALESERRKSGGDGGEAQEGDARGAGGGDGREEAVVEDARVQGPVGDDAGGDGGPLVGHLTGRRLSGGRLGVLTGGGLEVVLPAQADRVLGEQTHLEVNGGEVGGEDVGR